MVYGISKEEVEDVLQKELSRLRDEGKEADEVELREVIQNRLEAEMKERAQWDWWYAPEV